MATLSDGSLWAWGDDSHGQLGLGDLVPGSAQVPACVRSLARVMDLFKKWDVDHNGSIDKKEVRQYAPGTLGEHLA